MRAAAVTKSGFSGYFADRVHCYTGRMEIAERAGTLITLTEPAAGKIKELIAEEGEYEFTLHGVDVVVDPFSAPYLQGATIDFLNGLQESGFKIDNPNVSASCGCGHSFQVEEGEAPADAGPGCGSGCGS